MTNREKIGRRIAAARYEAGLTQRELADAVGRSTHTVPNWESGQNMPSPEVLAQIAAATGKPVSYFLGEQQEEAMSTAALVHRLEALLGAGSAQTIEGGLLTIPVYERVAAGPGGIADATPVEFRHIPRTWIPDGQEAACFLVRATGDSMADVGIAEGDELLVCTAVRVHDGDIAVVDLGDEVVVKRVYRHADSLLLISEHAGVAPREVAEGRIVGRVMRSSRSF
jgi:SOS-response transcriptional repressor LexA